MPKYRLIAGLADLRIGTHLRSALDASAQIFNEAVRIDRIFFADMEGRNNFRNGIERNVGIRIPTLVGSSGLPVSRRLLSSE